MLWLPRSKINEAVVKTATTILTTNPRSGKPEIHSMARETQTHLVVPRELYNEDQLPDPVIISDVPGSPVQFLDFVTVRERQALSWDALAVANGGILNLACGKGKTVLALKKIAKEGKAAIVVAGKSLLTQWEEEARRFLGLNELDIGYILGPRMEWNNKSLVLASIDTLARRAKEGRVPWDMRMHFGTIVYDEVHHLSAPEFVLTAPLFFGKRFGLSATPKREDGLEPIYMAHLGGVFFSDMKQERDPRIYFQQLDTILPPSELPEVMDRSGEIHHGRLCIWLGRQPERNQKILEHVSAAVTNGRKILLLSQSKEHVGLMHASIPGSGIIDGDIPMEDRTHILNNHQVTVAILSIAKEGLNAVDLDTVMFLTPFKAWGTFQQGVGRTLRNKENKARSVAVVFWDHNIDLANGLCYCLMREARRNGWEYIRNLSDGKSNTVNAKPKC